MATVYFQKLGIIGVPFVCVCRTLEKAHAFNHDEKKEQKFERVNIDLLQSGPWMEKVSVILLSNLHCCLLPYLFCITFYYTGCQASFTLDCERISNKCSNEFGSS